MSTAIARTDIQVRFGSDSMTVKKAMRSAESRASYGSPKNRTFGAGSDSPGPIPRGESDLIAERIRNVIGDESQRAFARRSDVSEGALRDYLTGDKIPGLMAARSIADAGGVLVDWLATGRLPKTRAELKALRLPAGETADGYVAVPLYNAVRAAAGAGAVVEAEIADDVLMFKADWIRRELGARPHDLYLIRVSGDSMVPTLRSGDVILVDRRATSPDREGIYIMRMAGMLLVKRLQALPGRRVRVTSDNPAFAPYEVALSELNGEEMVVIGRVVWSGHRL